MSEMTFEHRWHSYIVSGIFHVLYGLP